MKPYKVYNTKDAQTGIYPAALMHFSNQDQSVKASAKNDYLNANTSGSSFMPPRLNFASAAIQRTGDQEVQEDTHSQRLFSEREGTVSFDAHTIEHEFLHAQFRGAGNTTLKAVLLKLYELHSIGDGTQLPSHHPVMMSIYRLSELRGLNFETAKRQYIKALELRQKAEDTLALKGKGPVDHLNIQQHPDFAGSTEQLRFGKIVGDVFNLDPAMATILSPTGGIVGPGNAAVDADSLRVGAAGSPVLRIAAEMLIHQGGNENSVSLQNMLNPHGAVSIHGAIHDAAGFLYNAFNIGPGYDYLNREIGSNPGNPMTGQSNIEAIQDMMARQGLSNGQNGGSHIEQALSSGANSYRSAQFNLTGDTNIRERVQNMEQREILQLDSQTLITMISRLLSGYISNADIEAVEKLAYLMSNEQRSQVRQWYLRERPTILSLFQKNRVTTALTR